MEWGTEHDVGHYLDFEGAVLGITLFPIGYVSRADPSPPHVLLRTIAVRHDCFQASTVGGADIDDDPVAHPQDSHANEPMGIYQRRPPSDFIHSHVRHHQMQASEFVACVQALVSGSSGQGRRRGRRNDVDHTLMRGSEPHDR